MKKIHYAWVISIVCALIQICTNGLTISIMGTYLPFIQEQGYSGTAVSTLVTLRCMAAMAAMAIAPWLYRHVSLRRGLICCCASAAITLYLMAAAKSYLAYAVYAVLLGGTYGLGAMIPLSLLISNWFDSHRATALSICTLGTGISSMVMPPLVTGVAQGKSLAAAFHMMGSICLIVMLIAIFTVRNYPEDIGQSIYHIDTEAGTAAKGRNRVERTHYRLTKMQSFGMILAVVLLGSVSMAGCAHYAVLFTNCGYSKGRTCHLFYGNRQHIRQGDLRADRGEDRQQKSRICLSVSLDTRYGFLYACTVWRAVHIRRNADHGVRLSAVNRRYINMGG